MPSDTLTVPAPRMVRFDGTVNAGHLLTAGAIIVSFITWLALGVDKGNQAQRSVDDLRARVDSSAQTTREEVKSGLGRLEAAIGGVQTQLVTLPDLSARLRQAEEAVKRLEDRDTQFARYLDERRAAADQRFQQLEQRAIESIADRRELRGTLDQLQRASAVNLPGSRGVR